MATLRPEQLRGGTAGHIFVDDGTRMRSVAAGGDLTLASNGNFALASTIAAGSGNDASKTWSLAWDLKGRLLTATAIAIAIAQSQVSGLTTADSPTFAGLTLTGLTASVPVVTNASKALSSVSYATFTASLSQATATVAGTVPTPPNDVTKFLSGLATWVVPTVSSVNGSAYPSGAVLGSTLYGSAANTYANLSPNITTTKKYLSMTGTGSVGAIPAWLQPAAADLSDGTTGSGSVVLATSPTLVAPLLGTPTSGTLTNCTSLPAGGIVGGTLGKILYDNGTIGAWSNAVGANQVVFGNASQVPTGDAGFTYGGTGGSTLAFLTATSTSATVMRMSLPASSANATFNCTDSAGRPVLQHSVNTSGSSTLTIMSPSAVAAGSLSYGTLTLATYPYQTAGNSVGTIASVTRQGTNSQVTCAAIQFVAAEAQASGKISADIQFDTCAVGASTLTNRWTFSANGNTVLNATGSALATSATSGMTFIPTCAGAPTGNGDKYTGAIGMLYDTTNNKLWVNTSGTTWKGVVLA